MKSYDILLIDLDYTLLDFESDCEAAFKELYSRCFMSQRPYEVSVQKLYERCNNLWWEKFERKECTKPELFIGRFEDFLRLSGLSGDPKTINDVYFEELAKGGRPYPGALELLKRLGEKYRIYIITNGNAVTANTRIRNSGVLPLVSGYFVSESIGAGKPDPAYFDYVFSHIPGFSREAALVIGDSLSSDILGANRAGVDSLWYYNSFEKKGQVSATPTYTAKSYGEIMDLLL